MASCLPRQQQPNLHSSLSFQRAFIVPHDHRERSPVLDRFNAIFQEHLRVVPFARLVLVQGLAIKEPAHEKLIQRAPGKEREEVKQEEG